MKKKLKKLGLDCTKFINPDTIIFNYSDVTLNQKQKAALGVGLNYSLPINHKYIFKSQYKNLNKNKNECTFNTKEHN